MSTAMSRRPTGTRGAKSVAALTAAVGLGILLQAVLAGLFTGADHPHAKDVHQIVGPLLIVPALASTVIAYLTLRSAPGGRRLYMAAAGLTLALAVETALGFSADDHGTLLAVHIPLAVAIFGMLAVQFRSLRAIAAGG